MEHWTKLVLCTMENHFLNLISTKLSLDQGKSFQIFLMFPISSQCSQ